MSLFKKPKPPPAQEAPKITALPDFQDAAVRQRQHDLLSDLKNRRGRSSTILSGRTGDQTPTPKRRTLLGRG